jgi:glycosyltransferase involved in cell wall biosynthesis
MAWERLPVTLLVGTYNAASLLPDCIASCSDWVSEVLIVDMESEDGTPDLAKSLGARVISIPNALIVEPGRQVGIDRAAQPWVAILDADERFRPEMRELAADYIRQDDLAGVWLPRQNLVLGRWLRHGGFWPDRQLRLFRRDAIRWPERIHGAPEVRGRVIHAAPTQQNAIIHLHGETVTHWIAKINEQTDGQARHEVAEGRPPSLYRLLRRPAASFYRRYLRGRGFRDGMQGFVIALILVVYDLLVELKLWDLDRRGER